MSLLPNSASFNWRLVLLPSSPLNQKSNWSFYIKRFPKIVKISPPRSRSRNLLEANCRTNEELEISIDCCFGFIKPYEDPTADFGSAVCPPCHRFHSISLMALTSRLNWHYNLKLLACQKKSLIIYKYLALSIASTSMLSGTTNLGEAVAQGLRFIFDIIDSPLHGISAFKKGSDSKNTSGWTYSIEGTFSQITWEANKKPIYWLNSFTTRVFH